MAFDSGDSYLYYTQNFYPGGTSVSGLKGSTSGQLVILDVTGTTTYTHLFTAKFTTGAGTFLSV
jgi:hypothetical protein